MNSFQELWWRQARSDYSAMDVLRRHGADPCQQLHYLQMITEKLAKAHFWRYDEAPPRSHASFVRFLRFLGAVRRSERERVTTAFGFQRFQDFRRWIRTILPLAYELERLAPALAGDGPNIEYPWPWEAPQDAPALFHFDIWDQLLNTGRGRGLLEAIRLGVLNFPRYQ